MTDLEHSELEATDTTLTAERLEGRNDWRGDLVSDTPLELASRYIAQRMKAVDDELNKTGKILPETDHLRQQMNEVKTVIRFLNSTDTTPDGSKKSAYPLEVRHLDPFMQTVNELATAQRWRIVHQDPATLGKEGAAKQEAEWAEQALAALEQRKEAIIAKIEGQEDPAVKSRLEDLLLSLESGDPAMLAA